MSASKSRRGDVKEIGRGGVQEYFDEAVAKAGGMTDVFDNYAKKIGRPDRIVTWPRAGFAAIDFVELKTIGGKLESWQARDHERRRKLGAYVVVLWTKDMVDYYIWLRAQPPF